jgi:Leucine-rich repeat (LRR) protein
MKSLVYLNLLAIFAIGSIYGEEVQFGCLQGSSPTTCQLKIDYRDSDVGQKTLVFNETSTTRDEIIIENSVLEVIPPSLFESFTNLKNLTIKNSGLRKLNYKFTATQSQSLTDIDVNNNALSVLYTNSLANQKNALPNIKSLNLAKNFIKKIQTDAFMGLENLKELNLAGNYLTEFESVFKELDGLENLDLSGNFIGKLGGEVPKGIKKLNLANNVIYEIEIEMFNERSFELDLKGNQPPYGSVKTTNEKITDVLEREKNKKTADLCEDNEDNATESPPPIPCSALNSLTIFLLVAFVILLVLIVILLKAYIQIKSDLEQKANNGTNGGDADAGQSEVRDTKM